MSLELVLAAVCNSDVVATRDLVEGSSQPSPTQRTVQPPPLPHHEGPGGAEPVS